MQQRDSARPGRKGTIVLVAVLVILAAAAGWFAQRLFAGPGNLSSGNRQAIESVVREYILENPEILPQAMDNLHRKENAAQLSAVRGEVETPFPGAVLGNPEGEVTLVEFTDFACGYCRKSVDDVEALIAAHPELRIVVRELPILGPQSVEAAKMALAAAEQGKYAQFHRAMFAAGRPDPAAIEAAAREAGLDMARARATAGSERVQEELAANVALARQLGFSGTPSWVAGDELISGAVGTDRLAEALRGMEPG